MKKFNKNGFTLIEIMTTVMIVVTLATIGMVEYHKVLERSDWAGPVRMLAALKSASLRYYQANEAYITNVAQLDMENPNPTGAPLPNQFRYTFSAGPETPGGPILLVLVWRDTDGDGMILPPYPEPHIWIYDEGNLSSRSGAPVF